LVESLKTLAEERLTQKQKFILLFLASLETKVNVTQLVGVLTEELDCSASAVWNNLKSLKRAGLVSFGSKNSKGKLVRLTKVGMELML